ncbi:Hypothetical predicted protein [Pelobates cultripes]|uniref:Uncharacterized protein n=1 Tax=Pelobates cultripes TaxID=61616 RepID=A0AAD1RFQ0_PELCU|nr:Hypothetical predicted protein [Pelobates cultripes]
MLSQQPGLSDDAWLRGQGSENPLTSGSHRLSLGPLRIYQGTEDVLRRLHSSSFGNTLQ